MELMFITNDPQIAQLAEKAGIDRIFIDLEIFGKKERQKNHNTVISEHSLDDIVKVRKMLKTSKLMVRINPINERSKDEIDEVIKRDPDIIMLPMFTTPEEVRLFISYVNKKASTCLLLETPQALVRLDEILAIEGIDEIHVGLNDLHLGLGLDFMFELLSGGMVEYIANKVTAKGIRFGFGGVSRIDSGVLSANLILSEHYRLGSEMVILSREFHGQAKSLSELQHNIDLESEIKKIRTYENKLKLYTDCEFNENKQRVKEMVRQIVILKEKSKKKTVS